MLRFKHALPIIVNNELIFTPCKFNVKSRIHVHASAKFLNLVGVSVKLFKSFLSHVKKLTFMFAMPIKQILFFSYWFTKYAIFVHMLYISNLFYMFLIYSLRPNK
jgi:hypothetical protein